MKYPCCAGRTSAHWLVGLANLKVGARIKRVLDPGPLCQAACAINIPNRLVISFHPYRFASVIDYRVGGTVRERCGM